MDVRAALGKARGISASLAELVRGPCLAFRTRTQCNGTRTQCNGTRTQCNGTHTRSQGSVEYEYEYEYEYRPAG